MNKDDSPTGLLPNRRWHIVDTIEEEYRQYVHSVESILFSCIYSIFYTAG